MDFLQDMDEECTWGRIVFDILIKDGIHFPCKYLFFNLGQMLMFWFKVRDYLLSVIYFLFSFKVKEHMNNKTCKKPAGNRLYQGLVLGIGEKSVSAGFSFFGLKYHLTA